MMLIVQVNLGNRKHQLLSVEQAEPFLTLCRKLGKVLLYPGLLENSGRGCYVLAGYVSHDLFPDTLHEVHGALQRASASGTEVSCISDRIDSAARSLLT